MTTKNSLEIALENLGIQKPCIIQETKRTIVYLDEKTIWGFFNKTEAKLTNMQSVCAELGIDVI